MNPLLETTDAPATEQSGHQTLQVRVLRSIVEIDEIRDVWTSWNYHPNSDGDFYLLLLKNNPQFERPHIVVIYRGQDPECMLIGRIVRQRIDFKIGYKTIFRPKARVLNFVYGGSLGDLSPECSQLMVKSILDSLRQGEADLANLNFLRTDSPLHACATRLPGPLSRDLFPAPQPHWQITLSGGAEAAFLHGNSAKDFRELRRKARKLFADHSNQVKFCRFGKPSELEEMMKDIEQVAKGTYQRGLGAGFVDNDERRRVLRFHAEKGWLRAYVLYVAEKPCAFWVGVAYRGVFYGGSIGYDQKYAKYAAGKYVMMKGMEDLCRDCVGAVDFGFGDAEYKQMLADRGWVEASPYIFAPSLSGLRLSLLRTPMALVDKFSRQGLKQLGLIPKVKRAWRESLRPASEQSDCERR
jgi:hypothetical protein